MVGDVRKGLTLTPDVINKTTQRGKRSHRRRPHAGNGKAGLRRRAGAPLRGFARPVHGLRELVGARRIGIDDQFCDDLLRHLFPCLRLFRPEQIVKLFDDPYFPRRERHFGMSNERVDVGPGNGIDTETA